MEMLNNQITNYINPYLADLGVALAFGVGCLLFKSFKKDSNLSSLKKKINTTLNKWESAKSLQKFHSLILNNTNQDYDAFKILKHIQESSLQPDTMTYNCLIQMSFNLQQEEIAKKLFDELSFNNVKPDIVTYNILIKNYVEEVKKLKESTEINGVISSIMYKDSINIKLNEVRDMIKEINEKELIFDDFTYNTIIDFFVECGDLKSALDTFSKMKSNIKETEAKPDIYTYSTLIKGLKSDINSEENFLKVSEIYNKAKQGELDVKLDDYLLNSILDAYVKFGKNDEAIKIFKDSESNCLKLSVVTYSIILKALANLGKLEEAIELFNKMKLSGIEPNEVSYDCLLNCAIKVDRLDIMKDIYQNMKNDKISPNGVIFSTLVKGFNRTKNYNKAFEMYNSMSETDIQKTDIVFFNSLLDCAIEANDYNRMNELYEVINKRSKDSKFSPSVITFSTLLKGYTKFNDYDKAETLFNRLVYTEKAHVDEVFFNTMADYYAKNKNLNKALKVYNIMKEKGIIRSSVIYTILIKLYSNIEDENKAIEIYNEMISNGFKPTLITYTTLMQMYIKRKKLDQALEYFYEMRDNNIADAVCYNFIINGCSFNKKLETAISILLESISRGIKLNENTYGNVIDYLMNNKFMNFNSRCQYIGEILQELKSKGINLRYDIYSKAAKMVYNQGGKIIEDKLNSSNKFDKFSSFKNAKTAYAVKENESLGSSKLNFNTTKETVSDFSSNSIYSNEKSFERKEWKAKDKGEEKSFNRSGKYKTYNQF